MIPLLLAATFGALRVRNDLIESADASSSAKQVTVLRPAVDYLTAAERALVAVSGATANGRADLESAVQDLRAAADDLENTRDSADLTAEQRYQVDVVLDLSRVLREGDIDQLTLGTWQAQLRQLQSGVTQLITTIVNAQLDPEPRLEQLAQALSGRFSLAMQQSVFAAVQSGATGPLVLYSELGAESTAIDRLASAVGDSEPSIAALRTANSLRTSDVATNQEVLGNLGAYAEYDDLTTKFLDDIDQQLDTNASDARQRALVNGGITLAALLAAILLALVVSRLLLNPIRKVREGTLAVANEQLPEAVAKIRAGGDPGPIEPIDVTTHEEIGTMARAVDDLHRQAVLLASREAGLRAQVSDMFVTLSRRHNSLINQQLDLIETLEKDEEDSRRLESLFLLDHLAARMRRTSESLLVLAEAPATRAAANEELTVSAALQAATAAVQHYQRVRIGRADNSRISDAAAADVVHLLTELVDNALAYSSPASSVSLESVATGEGVVIEIADAGLGISSGSLAELNEILHSGGEVTPDTARRMGILVVSRLAQRHGIRASLQANQQGGITARVVLPTSVIEKRRPVDTGPRMDGAPSLNRVLPEQRHAATAPDELGFDSRIEQVLDLPPLPPVQDPPRPGPALPVPTAGQAAESDLPWTGGVEGGDTPIFQEMSSAWLSADQDVPWISTEVEVGWDRADEVATALAETQVSASGLPLRRPGNRLVPGSVTKATPARTRDPEAVRARLAAHAEGVARGRSAAAGPDQSSTEVGPS
ncbi:MAG TPA: ATP-binding protein [Nocardioidaceae bacterium]|nr:ATP-binding protein [Nocardioidaceae bacterium]